MEGFTKTGLILTSRVTRALGALYCFLIDSFSDAFMSRAPPSYQNLIDNVVQEIFISGELVLNCVSVNDVGVEDSNGGSQT